MILLGYKKIKRGYTRLIYLAPILNSVEDMFSCLLIKPIHMRYTVDYTAEFDRVKQSTFDYLFSGQEVCI